MPSPTYKQNKKSIYNWRSHPENMAKQLASNRISTKKYDTWKRIQKIYLNILL